MASHRDFADRIGQNFTLDTESGVVTAVLSECLSTSANSFSLTFTSETDEPIEQGSYSVAGDGLGPELIFLVPTGRNADGGFDYQAVFNQLPN